MIRHNESHESSKDELTQSPRRRSSRRWAVGIIAGIVAAVGIGLAVQNPIDAAQASEAPMGAQLPWDDSTLDNSSFDDSKTDQTHGAPGDDVGRGSKKRDGMGRGEHGGKPGDRRGDRSMMDDRPGGLRQLVALAAETLEMTPEELVTELRAGRSIADVAEERGVPVQDVIDALVDDVVEHATARITDLVNRNPRTLGSDTPES